MRSTSELEQEILKRLRHLIRVPHLRTVHEEDTERFILEYASLLAFAQECTTSWNEALERAHKDRLSASTHLGTPVLDLLRAQAEPAKDLRAELAAVYAEVAMPFGWTVLDHAEPLDKPISPQDGWWRQPRTRMEVHERLGPPNFMIRKMVSCYQMNTAVSRCWTLFAFRPAVPPDKGRRLMMVRYGTPASYFSPPD